MICTGLTTLIIVKRKTKFNAVSADPILYAYSRYVNIDLSDLWSDHKEGQSMEIGVIEAPTVRQLFIEKIARLIITGQLRPGDRLPSERELASQAKISKSAVHFAMAELERMGFVETNERHGTYVADFARTGNIETLNLLIRFNGSEFGRKKIGDMLEMRMAIEGKALERLAESLNDESAEILRKEVEEAKEIAEGKESDSVMKLASKFFDFHHAICVCSGNFILPLLFNSFQDVTRSYWEEAIIHLGREECIRLMIGMYETLLKKDSRESIRYLQQEFEMYMEKIQ